MRLTFELPRQAHEEAMLIGHFTRCIPTERETEYVKDGDRFVNRIYFKPYASEMGILESKFPGSRTGEGVPVTNYDLHFCQNSRATLEKWRTSPRAS